MRHRALRFAILALPLLYTTTLSAGSQPTLSGLVSGRELCQQSVCGAAIFLAGFAGEIGGRPAVGLAAGAIKHEPLPAIGATSAITGGRWAIRTLRRSLEGDVTEGTILNVNGTRFIIVLRMEITDGGSGEATFSAVLDHGPFPPTIQGTISQ
jgi:hypothetical protein